MEQLKQHTFILFRGQGYQSFEDRTLGFKEPENNYTDFIMLSPKGGYFLIRINDGLKNCWDLTIEALLSSIDYHADEHFIFLQYNVKQIEHIIDKCKEHSPISHYNDDMSALSTPNSEFIKKYNLTEIMKR